MGVGANGARFLLHAKREGAVFTRTATVGRMRMHMRTRALRQILTDFGYPAGREEVARLMTEQDKYSEPFFAWLGASEVCSFDASDYEGATVVHDFNLPIGEEFKNRFTVLYNGGSLEHVFNFPGAIKNCMEMLEVGGHFLSVGPANNLMGHGFYQFSPELFFRVFSAANGFQIMHVFLWEKQSTKWFEVADPDAIKQRVTLANRRGTSLAVMARRVQAVPVLVRAPQQSDYVDLWKAHSEAKGPRTLRPNRATRGILERAIRSYRKRFIRYRPEFFRRVQIP